MHSPLGGHRDRNGSYYVSQVGYELLDPSDPPASASQATQTIRAQCRHVQHQLNSGRILTKLLEANLPKQTLCRVELLWQPAQSTAGLARRWHLVNTQRPHAESEKSRDSHSSRDLRGTLARAEEWFLCSALEGGTSSKLGPQPMSAQTRLLLRFPSPHHHRLRSAGPRPPLPIKPRPPERPQSDSGRCHFLPLGSSYPTS
ncbi:uncharacterized protein LOC104867296 [Fukomys damarensis]|uniref:uncharacterized protein LOC104867296 n=1 Tax=Fukomys damarensis TaxID=885580 RepID=UPI00053F4C52|nr:uncharacterized protein LOC104867296 [Fukomys damarensis]